MNKFLNTAVGKSIQTLVWIVVAYALVFVTTWLANYKWPIALSLLGVPGIVNWLLYTVKVFVDKEIPNFPGSPVKILMTIPQPTPVTAPEVPVENPAPAA